MKYEKLLAGHQAYDPIAKSFHWVIALLIFGLLGLGLYLEDLPFSPAKLRLYDLHKSFGITVLALITLRVLWRISHTYPASLPTHQKWEKLLAKITHFALYFCAFAMPLSGWAMSSASGYGAHIFGLFNLPPIAPEDKELAKLFANIHGLTAWGLMGLIALHFLGAMKHHFIDKDSTLRRMLPFVKPVLFIAILCHLFGAVPAQAATVYTAFPADSSIAFSGQQRDEMFSGFFGEWEMDVAFSEDDLEHSNVKAVIQTDMISSKLSEVAQYATAPAWLDAANYPEATFVSKSFEKGQDGHFEVIGDFTLKGVTKEISFPFALSKDEKGRAVMEATFPIKRLEYNVGSGDWADTTFVGDEITITLHIVAVPKS